MRQDSELSCPALDCCCFAPLRRLWTRLNGSFRWYSSSSSEESPYFCLEPLNPSNSARENVPLRHQREGTGLQAASQARQEGVMAGAVGGGSDCARSTSYQLSSENGGNDGQSASFNLATMASGTSTTAESDTRQGHNVLGSLTKGQDVLGASPSSQSSQSVPLLSELNRKEDEAHEKECLLCYEVVTQSNPAVLSLCRCGVNKHTYHLQCLLRWRSYSQQRTCPICDQEIFFQSSQEIVDEPEDQEGQSERINADVTEEAKNMPRSTQQDVNESDQTLSPT